MNQELAKVIEALLRRIPDKWQRVDTEQLSVTEQQTLLRLVAAGLVERRNTLRLDMAGQNESFEATIAVTGEAGLLMAIEPVLAESWSRWSGAIEDWRRRTGAASRPFRVTKVGGDEWRLTENGLQGATTMRVIAWRAGSCQRSMRRCVSRRMAASSSTTRSGGSPPFD